MANHAAYIGFGSNMGDAGANCRAGLALLEQWDAWDVEDISRLYATEPVGFADQDWFVNGAARVRTALGPRELLARMKAAEKELGRVPGGVRNGPRPLDMDILFFGDLVLSEEGLVVPHPRLHKRRFVLAPLCDIAPELVHPVLGQTVRELLAGLPEDGQEVRGL